MKFTEAQADIIAESVETAHYWLSKTGRNTGPTMWAVMLAKLERAHRIIERRKYASKKAALSLAFALLSVCAFAHGGVGVDYPALYRAIRIVESEDGRTSPNTYQITRAFWTDVNRFRRWNWHPSSYPAMVECRPIAEEYMAAYWDYYGTRYQMMTGRIATAEVLAKLHRVGLRGLTSRRREAERYWLRVRKHYEEAADGTL